MSVSDEELIRQVVATWHAASRAGDVERVLSLIADDGLFLVAGRGPMTKAEFATLSRVPPGAVRPTMTSTFEIREVQVAGDWAYLWTELSVEVAPPGAERPVRRAGPTLSIFRRGSAGAWQLYRDANLLTVVQ
ncbi:MAG: SgcJ/EcaC family oxidoreductase [Pirellulales bacterium]